MVSLGHLLFKIMDPKEKALEIYNNHRNVAPVMEANARSKKAALITANEVLRVLNTDVSLDDSNYGDVGACTYWTRVISEIENL